MNSILAALLGMTALGTMAVFHLDTKVDKLLVETSKLQDRVLVLEEREPAVHFHFPEVTIEKTKEKIKYKQIDVFCMAKNIYHEARGEDIKGQYAVAMVTLNRIKNKKYPNTVCEVVMDPYQFSWANNRKIRWTRPKGKDWNEALHISEQVIKHGYRLKGLEQANYYHADYVNPNWKREDKMITKIGQHIFYSSARIK